MLITDYIQAGTPVLVRSYVSGVITGILAGGEAGTVVLSEWRWLRRWERVGGEGSCYDLVQSGQQPTRRGPMVRSIGVFQQADCMVISPEAYERLVGGE